MFENRKGAALTFIYAGLFIFACIIMYVVFNQIVTVNVYGGVTNDTAMFNMTATERADADRSLAFWHFTPYILIAIALIYIFVRLIFQQG